MPAKNGRELKNMPEDWIWRQDVCALMGWTERQYARHCRETKDIPFIVYEWKYGITPKRTSFMRLGDLRLWFAKRLLKETQRLFEKQGLPSLHEIETKLTFQKPKAVIEQNPLRRWRKSARYRAVDVAAKLGVTETALLGYEIGRYNPGEEVFQRIAALVGTELPTLSIQWARWREQLAQAHLVASQRVKPPRKPFTNAP